LISVRSESSAGATSAAVWSSGYFRAPAGTSWVARLPGHLIGTVSTHMLC